MKNLRTLFILSGILSCGYFSYGQAPYNDNCSSAQVLTSNVICNPSNQTSQNATVQASEVTSPAGCWSGAGFNQTIWYGFQATATHMYIESYVTGLTGPGNGFNYGKWGSVLYNTLACVPASSSIISCNNSDAEGNHDGIVENDVTGLTVGNWYLVQIGYRTGSFKSPIFCISVGDNFTTGGTCASPAGSGCFFSSLPTISQVVSSCHFYDQRPYLEGDASTSQCFTFTPTSSSVNFGLVVNSTCEDAPGDFGVINSNSASTTNTASLSWSLQQSSCASVLQSGTLSSMLLTGLTAGTQYTLCYNITVPTACFHTGYYPYFYPAVMLPIELTSFTAAGTSKGVELNWSSASEMNNNYYSVQRSLDGVKFDEIARITGAGYSSQVTNYTFTDNSPSNGTNYYRLVQNDFDGAVHYTQVLSVSVSAPLTGITMVPNPVKDEGTITVVSNSDRDASVIVYDAIGRVAYTEIVKIHSGKNEFNVNFRDLKSGIYNLILLSSEGTQEVTFIK